MKADFEAQKKIKATEFAEMTAAERERIEGVQPGKYVRVVLKAIPSEFVRFLDPKYPIILGALATGEDTLGFMKVNIYMSPQNCRSSYLNRCESKDIAGERRISRTTIPLFSQ